MMGAEQHHAERGIDGDQGQIEFDRDRVEDRERRPVDERQPAQRRRGRHAPKPMMLFST